MKYNNHIDYFSSPNPKFIGFSEMRQPYQDTNNDNYQDDHQEDRKTIRKSSYNNTYEPIVPVGPEFFNQMLEFYVEPQQSESERNEDKFMMLKTSSIPSFNKSQNTVLKIDSVKSNNVNKPDFEDIFSEAEQQQIQLQDNSSCCQGIFATPKRQPKFPLQKRFFQNTGQKSISRNNEKGLRRLSSLAFSIVNHSPATTYKEVAQKLLTQLNFDVNELDDEDCRAEKSSMQNVKRRVYDSLNVLIALGVIQRVGNKITKQKRKQSFLSGQNPDIEKYNDLLDSYKNRLTNLQTKRKTEKQLKENMQLFKKIVQRNKKTKNIKKNSIIRLPFLMFVQKTLQNKKQSKFAEQAISQKIQWMNKKPIENSQKQKKNTKKRNQNNDIFLSQKTNDMIVQVNFRNSPESYGDFDIFRLVQEESWFSNQIILQQGNPQVDNPESVDEVIENYVEELNNNEYEVEANYIKSNLIDEVFGHE